MTAGRHQRAVGRLGCRRFLVPSSGVHNASKHRPARVVTVAMASSACLASHGFALKQFQASEGSAERSIFHIFFKIDMVIPVTLRARSFPAH